jgi:cell division transport system permease protein
MARRARDPWPRRQVGLAGWARDHGRTIGDSLTYVGTRLGTSLLVWLLVGIALALPAGLYLVMDRLSGMADQWQGRPGFSLYFDLGASDARVLAVAQQLREDPVVADVRVTTSEAALVEFADFVEVRDALELLDENPLPASIQVNLTATSGLAELEIAALAAGEAQGVAEVVIEKTWLERLAAITLVLQRLGIVLAVLFGLGALLVTASSVRLAIEAQLEELRVLKLVGATDAYVRRPFLYFGAWYGLGGALVAAMLISVVLLIIETPLAQLLGSYGTRMSMARVDPTFLGVLLGIGGSLGIGGAVLAVRRRLDGLEIA